AHRDVWRRGASPRFDAPCGSTRSIRRVFSRTQKGIRLALGARSRLERQYLGAREARDTQSSAQQIDGQRAGHLEVLVFDPATDVGCRSRMANLAERSIWSARPIDGFGVPTAGGFA